MKNRVINKDKIIEAFYLEPYEPDSEMPFGEKHEWRIILICDYLSDRYENKVTIDKHTEQECIDFIDNLGLLKI